MIDQVCDLLKSIFLLIIKLFEVILISQYLQAILWNRPSAKVKFDNDVFMIALNLSSIINLR